LNIIWTSNLRMPYALCWIIHENVLTITKFLKENAVKKT